MDFSWHVYLSETGAEVSPADLFQHVSTSLRTFIKKGDVVLFNSAYFNRPQATPPMPDSWWPAEVLTLSGSLILFKWCIPNIDSSLDQLLNGHGHRVSESTSPLDSKRTNVIWFDVKGSDWPLIRSFDVFEGTNAKLSPPQHFNWDPKHIQFDWRRSDWFSGLRKRAVSGMFFERQCLFAYEAIRTGGYFECEHEYNPCCVWPVKVLINLGGRVSLSWFGISTKGQGSKSSQLSPSTFTLFYLHRRLHPLGWGKRNGLKYCPPPGFSFDRAISNVDAFLRGACSAFPYECTKTNEIPNHSLTPLDLEPPMHEFRVGWKLEAVNPRKPYLVQPATVTKVFNSRYFLVELDDLRSQSLNDTETNSQNSDSSQVSSQSNIQFVGFAGMPEIMPANDSQLRGLHLASPPGWPTSRPFTWTNYLTYLSACKAKSDNHSENNLMVQSPVLSDRNLPSPPNLDLVQTAKHHSGLSNSLNFEENSIQQTPVNSVIFCPSESAFRGIRAPNPLAKSDIHSKNPKSTNSNDTNSSENVSRDEDTCPKLDRNETSSPSRFLLGMKLEMVVPNDFSYDRSAFEISPPLCTATVTRVDYPHLLWLLPDVPSNGDQRRRPLMIDARSTELYPVGWASSVGYPLIAPIGYQSSSDYTSVEMWANSNSTSSDVKFPFPAIMRPKHELQFYTVRYDNEELCPPIYINSKCYLGPFLCKSNLELLPRRFGPGPITRVMQYMITRLVRAAYRPTRVLRMLEADWASGIATSLNNFNSISKHPDGGFSESGNNGRSYTNVKSSLNQAETEVFEQRRTAMRVVLVTVRCPRRGIKMEAPVEVCCRARAVEEYCRQISLVLEACPHLLSSVPPETCESNCTGSAWPQLSPIDRSPGFPFEIMHTAPSYDCPSFCASRLRSRNLDRLPGWKKRSYASFRQFSLCDPSSNDQDAPSSQNLRTRSAVAAAAQRQNLSEGFDTDKSAQPSGFGFNNIAYDHGCKSFGGRFGSRPRGSSIRRTPSGSQLSQAASDTKLPNSNRGRSKRSLGSSVARSTKRCRDSPSTESLNEPVITDNGHSNQSTLSQPLVDSVLMGKCQPLVQQPFMSNCRQLWRPHYLPITIGDELPVTHAISAYSDRSRLQSGEMSFDCVPSEVYSTSNNFANSLFTNIPRITLSSNPMLWSPVDLASYLGGTDCREMWPWLAAEAVDGQAFMLLTLPVLHRLVGLRWEDAVRLARHVISVKQAFVEQFCTNSHVTENVFCTKAR